MRTRYPYDVFTDTLEWAVAVFLVAGLLAIGASIVLAFTGQAEIGAWAFFGGLFSVVLAYGALVWWLKRNFV